MAVNIGLCEMELEYIITLSQPQYTHHQHIDKAPVHWSQSINYQLSRSLYNILLRRSDEVQRCYRRRRAGCHRL